MQEKMVLLTLSVCLILAAKIMEYKTKQKVGAPYSARKLTNVASKLVLI